MSVERPSSVVGGLSSVNKAESFMHRKIGEMVVNNLRPIDVATVLADRDKKRNLGIYVHIPFCTEICAFCAFHREVFNSGRQDVYLQSLGAHIDNVLSNVGLDQSVEAVYFGGGTPGLLRAKEVGGLLERIGQHVDISPARVTFEMHPQDVNRQYVTDLVAAGVMRFSVGVQNLSDTERKLLHRDLTSVNQDISKLKTLDEMGVVFNVDLMFGTPNQTVQSWEETVSGLIDQLKPSELTLYQYVNAYGARTRVDIEKGLLSRPGVLERHTMYTLAKDKLLDEGYRQTSALTFSRSQEPRMRKLLNKGRDFIGLGPRVYSRVGRHFFINDARTADFIQGQDNERFYGFTTPEWFARMVELDSNQITGTSRVKDFLDPWESEAITQAYGVLYYVLNQQRIYKKAHK